MRDIKGTWLITHSKGQIVEGGKITSTWNRDVTSKQNHFVFYNDGRAVFMEIKGDYKDQTPYWTANGSAMFTLKDGQAIFSDGTLCAMKILSLKGQRDDRPLSALLGQNLLRHGATHRDAQADNRQYRLPYHEVASGALAA